MNLTESLEYKKLCHWLTHSSGADYGCVEVNTAQAKKELLTQLRQSVSRPVMEVDFSPFAKEQGKQDTDLVVTRYHYQTIQNFVRKYGEGNILVFTNLEQTVENQPEAQAQLIGEINMNRENYVRYPSVVLFVFSRWWMDQVLQQAHDFVSMMAFHVDLTGLEETVPVKPSEQMLETGREIPLLSMKDAYAQRMEDVTLPLLDRLKAAEKWLEICGYYYLFDQESQKRIDQIEEWVNGVEQTSQERAVAVAEVYHNLALVYYGQGNYENALEYYEKALKISEEKLGADHPNTAATYNNLAVVYDDQGNYEKALKYYEKALKVYEEKLGADHPDTAATYNNLAVVYYEQGNYEKALEYYEKALRIREEKLGADHPDTAATYNNLALVYDDQGNYEKALEYYEKALRIREEKLGADHPDTAATYNSLALVYYEQGNYEKALEYYEKALRIREEKLGADHPNTATTYNNLAVVYDDQGNYEKALKYYEKALKVYEEKLGAVHPDTAITYHNMAVVYEAQGDFEKALELAGKAYRIRYQRLGEMHPDTADSLQTLQRIWEEKGNSSADFAYWCKGLLAST